MVGTPARLHAVRREGADLAGSGARLGSVRAIAAWISFVGVLALLSGGGAIGTGGVVTTIPPAVLGVLGLMIAPVVILCFTRPLLAWTIALSLTLLPELPAQSSLAVFGPSDFAFVALACARVLRRFGAHNELRPRPGKATMVLYAMALLYAVVAGASSLTALSRSLVAKDVLKWVEIIAIVWTTVDILRDRRSLEDAMLAYWFVWVAAVLAVLGSQLPSWATGKIPYVRFGGEEGSLAAIIAVAIVLAAGSNVLRRAARAVALVALIVIGASLTRQSLISAPLAVVCMMVVVARTSQGARRALAGFLFLAATAALAIALIPQEIRDSFLTRIVTQDSASNLSRSSLLAAATDMFGRHPVLGVGAGNFPLELAFYQIQGVPSDASSVPLGPHNWFLTFAAETGLAGLTVFIGMLGTVSYAVRKAYKATAPRLSNWVELALVGVWVHWLVTFAFGDITGLLRLRLAATLGLMFAAYGLSARKVQAEASSETTTRGGRNARSGQAVALEQTTPH
jgi:O-antigen ligase